MVLADSHEISRAPCYSGTTSHHTHHGFVYGTHTPYGLALTTSSTTTMLQRPGWRPREQRIPQPRSCNPRQVSHTTGLATIRFRSPLLTESLLFSLPAGTEMFHFPAFPPAPYVFRYRSSPSQTTGFPHSEILGSQPAYRLPEAYRRLPRPSSAPDAKASTVRP